MSEHITCNYIKKITGNNVMKERNLYEGEEVENLIMITHEQLSNLIFPRPKKIN